MAENSLLTAAKLSLKKSGTAAFDADIKRLIAAAKADLKAEGITKGETDPLIAQACILYTHAHFGESDNPERFAQLYTELRDRLSMMSDYNAAEPAAETEMADTTTAAGGGTSE